MPEFAQQHVLCCVSAKAVGCVHENQQEGMSGVVWVEQGASRQENLSPADAGKVVLDLIVDYGRGFRDYLHEQHTQLGNVPLAVAQIIKVLPYRFVTINFERLKERTVGAPDAKTFIQHEHWIGYGIDDTLRLNVAVAQKAIKVFRIHHELPCIEGPTLQRNRSPFN
jgi:hypothetical protein